MMFAKQPREGVRSGAITCSVRIWTRPHVRVGARYRVGRGEIEVDSIETIGFPDITPELARESGFLGVLDLLKVAKHGRGENIPDPFPQCAASADLGALKRRVRLRHFMGER